MAKVQLRLLKSCTLTSTLYVLSTHVLSTFILDVALEIYKHVDVYVYICMYPCTHACMHVSVYLCIYFYTYLYCQLTILTEKVKHSIIGGGGRVHNC